MTIQDDFTDDTTSKMETALARLFDLITLLRREELPSSEIIERLQQHYAPHESGQRQVRRDIATLRLLGFIITDTRGPRRYVLSRDILAARLDDEQLDALAMLRDSLASNPLSESLHGMLRIITLGLSEEQRAYYTQPSPIQLSLRTATNYEGTRALLRRIKRALRSGNKVRFTYRSPGAETAPLEHVVDPLEIEYYHQHIYLVGHSHHGPDVIYFRIDRIDAPTFSSLPIPAAKKEPFVYLFRYRLSPALARRGISERFAHQRIIERCADGSVEIEARERSQFYALRGLLFYADNVTATFPQDLVQAMIATIDRMRGVYNENSSEDPAHEDTVRPKPSDTLIDE